VFGIGMPELLVVLVVALLVLGPKRLPEVARSLGRGLAEFRRASSDLRKSLVEPIESAASVETPPAPTAKAPPEPTPKDTDRPPTGTDKEADVPKDG